MKKKLIAILIAIIAFLIISFFALLTLSNPQRSAGIGEPKISTESGQENILSFGGVNRTYILHAPAHYDPAKTYPLMVVFHGSGGNAAAIERTTNFDAAADENNFFVIYPDSVGGKWIFTGTNNDIDFSETLIRTLEARYAIDTTKVYVSGFSQGGGMAQQLACNFTVKLAGLAVVAENLNSASENNCHPGKPISFVLFHGTADPISPYSGGASAISGGLTYSAKQTAEFWANKNGCTVVSDAVSIPDKLTDGSSVTDSRQAWSGCKDGVNVTFYTIEGGGHTWPGNVSGKTTYGPASANLNASELIWQELDQ